MKIKVFVAILSTLVFGSNGAKADLQEVTQNNIQVAVKHFSSKLVKGKLDKKGYGPLREKIGTLKVGQLLESGLAILVPHSLKIYDESYSESMWYVSVYKVTEYTPQDELPVFKTIVQCKTQRSRQSSRMRSYTWYPDCRVYEVIQ